MKHVRAICHEPIAIRPDFKQPWADVWIRYKAAPGRKVYEYGPTLVTKPDAERDFEISKTCQAEHPELDFSSDIAESERVMAFFANGGDILIGNDWEHGTPTIYTAKDYIDRPEAERMLRALMLHLGFRSIKLKWNKPKTVITPI